jgi:hypothetical protein
MSHGRGAQILAAQPDRRNNLVRRAPEDQLAIAAPIAIPAKKRPISMLFPEA